jgi:hypothetical protein
MVLGYVFPQCFNSSVAHFSPFFSKSVFSGNKFILYEVSGLENREYGLRDPSS